MRPWQPTKPWEKCAQFVDEDQIQNHHKKRNHSSKDLNYMCKLWSTSIRICNNWDVHTLFWNSPATPPTPPIHPLHSKKGQINRDWCHQKKQALPIYFLLVEMQSILSKQDPETSSGWNNILKQSQEACLHCGYSIYCFYICTIIIHFIYNQIQLTTNHKENPSQIFT